MALGGLDLLGDRGDDAIDDGVEHRERLVSDAVELVRPDDARGLGLDELDDHRKPRSSRRTDPLATYSTLRSLPASSAPSPRSPSANVVPRAITNRTRSFARRVMTSSVRPSANRLRSCSCSVRERSTKRMTATDALRRERMAGPASVAGSTCGAASATTARASLAAAALIAFQRSRTGDQSSPSCSNERIVDATCSSASRMRPPVTSASSRSSWLADRTERA